MPLLHLLDSLVKELGEPYRRRVQANLVANFAHVFGQVPDKVGRYEPACQPKIGKS